MAVTRPSALIGLCGPGDRVSDKPVLPEDEPEISCIRHPSNTSRDMSAGNNLNTESKRKLRHVRAVPMDLIRLVRRNDLVFIEARRQATESLP